MLIQITNRCQEGCRHCLQNAMPDGPIMTESTFRKVIEFGIASIEPVIDPMKSLQMIHQTLGFCDLYKVGLISGKGKGFYEDLHLSVFWGNLIDLTEDGFKIYPKDSLLNYLDEERSTLEGDFVTSDYNIFNT